MIITHAFSIPITRRERARRRLAANQPKKPTPAYRAPELKPQRSALAEAEIKRHREYERQRAERMKQEQRK